jgi:hypothetical protein
VLTAFAVHCNTVLASHAVQVTTAEVVDLATIAFILNVRPSNGCEGRVLSEAMN